MFSRVNSQDAGYATVHEQKHQGFRIVERELEAETSKEEETPRHREMDRMKPQRPRDPTKGKVREPLEIPNDYYIRG